MTSTECVGWKESVVGLESPWAPTLHLQSVSNQWMNKKEKKEKQNHTNSQKRDLYFFLFFWTKIKAESREVIFSCCSFCPAIRCSWKTKPRNDLLRSPSQAEDSLKTGNLFFGFGFFPFFSESHPRALSQTLRSHLSGSTAGRETRRAAFCFFTWD